MSTQTLNSLGIAEHTVRVIATTAVAREEEFCELDSIVGDGDFGYSLARGFEIVLSDWDDFPRDDAGSFLVSIALSITKHIGGTSGPIWGTAFLRAGTSLKSKAEVSGEDLVVALRSAIEGIKARGRSDVGDKTLLDSLVPATDELELAISNGLDARETLFDVATAARTSAEATSLLQAKRGRASYSGERSIGSPDAGAVAIAVLCEELLASWPPAQA